MQHTSRYSWPNTVPGTAETFGRFLRSLLDLRGRTSKTAVRSAVSTVCGLTRKGEADDAYRFLQNLKVLDASLGVNRVSIDKGEIRRLLGLPEPAPAPTSVVVVPQVVQPRPPPPPYAPVVETPTESVAIEETGFELVRDPVTAQEAEPVLASPAVETSAAPEGTVSPPAYYTHVAYFTPLERELHLAFAVESQRVTVNGRHHRIPVCEEERDGVPSSAIKVWELVEGFRCSHDDVGAAIQRFVRHGHIRVLDEDGVAGCKILDILYNPFEVDDRLVGDQQEVDLPVLQGFERERPSVASESVRSSTPPQSVPVSQVVFVRWSVYLTPEEAALILACRQRVEAGSELGKKVAQLLAAKPPLLNYRFFRGQHLIVRPFGGGGLYCINTRVAGRCQFLAAGSGRPDKVVTRVHASSSRPADHWIVELEALAASSQSLLGTVETLEREITIRVPASVPESRLASGLVVEPSASEPVPIVEAEAGVAAPSVAAELVPLADFLRELDAAGLDQAEATSRSALAWAERVLAAIAAERGRRVELARCRAELERRRFNAETLRRQAEEAATAVARLEAELAALG